MSYVMTLTRWCVTMIVVAKVLDVKATTITTFALFFSSFAGFANLGIQSHPPITMTMARHSDIKRQSKLTTL
jgi:hypothetical protein